MKPGLLHIGDESMCLKRIKRGRGFSYLDENGEKLTSKKVINRINDLVIPLMLVVAWL